MSFKLQYQKYVVSVEASLYAITKPPHFTILVSCPIKIIASLACCPCNAPSVLGLTRRKPPICQDPTVEHFLTKVYPWIGYLPITSVTENFPLSVFQKKSFPVLFGIIKGNASTRWYIDQDSKDCYIRENFRISIWHNAFSRKYLVMRCGQNWSWQNHSLPVAKVVRYGTFNWNLLPWKNLYLHLKTRRMQGISRGKMIKWLIYNTTLL